MNKLLLVSQASVLFAWAVLPMEADSNAVDTSNGPSLALLDTQLSDLVNQTVAAANAGKGKIVLDAISQQYRDAGEKVLKAFDKGATMDKAILRDFNSYSITEINRVLVDHDIAYVEAKVTYHPDALADIHQDEKDKANDTADGSLWGDMGGDSSANKYETGGAGLATYYVVRQRGAWKIHSTYFSLEPMTRDELNTVSKGMKTLVE